MNENPLVTIICLSYNHAPYIREALDSVFNQTYRNVEIIVIDDASSDGSKEVIEEYLKQKPHIEFINLKVNMGNCKAFNLGWKKALGEFIVDFALDDVLLPTRIASQVHAFKGLGKKYGVVFSKVTLIGKDSKKIGVETLTISQGDVYKDLLERYFVNPTSMMVRREVFEKLGGYDESLAYEDFDFWVRSSRDYYYYFVNELQTLKRVLPTSHGSKFNHKRQYLMQESTLKVCYKAFHLNKSSEENSALATRIRFHLRQALFTENFSLVNEYFNLLTKLTRPSFQDHFWLFLAKSKLPLFWLYSKRK